MKKTGSEHSPPAEPLERARLQADVAKQRVRIAKDELKRARKRLKEAKREAKRARKLAAATRKAWKRARRAQKNDSAKSAGTQAPGSRVARTTRKLATRPARRIRSRRRALARRDAARRARRVLAKRVVAKRVRAKRVLAKRVRAKRVRAKRVAKAVVAKAVVAKAVVTKRVRGPSLCTRRRPPPVRRAVARAPGVREARSAVSARRVLRRRARASVAGRAAGIAAVPMATRVTTPPVPVAEATPGLDNATVATTPDQAS